MTPQATKMNHEEIQDRRNNRKSSLSYLPSILRVLCGLLFFFCRGRQTVRLNAY